jgi:AraC-like DNA-binding protein
MDRHYLPEEATAEIVAQLHQEDLKIQDKFNCRGLTYWFDDKRKIAFCLVEAPHKEAITMMHDSAHGEVPNQIIEVNPTIVESFLGRIEDPEKSQNTKLNIINDPAFRTIMVIGLAYDSFKNYQSFLFSSLVKDYIKSVSEIILLYKGSIVNTVEGRFLVSFESVSQAVMCATQVQSKFNDFFAETGKEYVELKIGIDAGIPVTDKVAIFEDTIKLAERMFYIENAEIVVSAEVKDLYKSENLNRFIEGNRIIALTNPDEIFLTKLMDFTEKEVQNTDLKVEDYQKELGFSKSKFYRKMIELTGKSPNTFLLNYRLNKALQLLIKKNATISEIAFETGFNIPSYFSKCFRKKYGIIPSDYHRISEV